MAPTATPNPPALAAFCLLLGTIELQVRVVEEPSLARVHGDTYRQYRRTVGRFLPGIGRFCRESAAPGEPRNKIATRLVDPIDKLSHKHSSLS